MEYPQKRKRSTMLLGVLQLLPTIHQRIQQDSKTAIQPNEERHQVGMGRKGGRGLPRNNKTTGDSPDPYSFQPRQTNTNRNGRLRLRMRGHTITTRRKRIMETDCLSLQINDEGRTELRHLR